MPDSWILRISLFLFAVFVVGLLATLVLPEDAEDPCANPQGDISAAVLADHPDDQDALVNRAIIIKSNCKQKD